MTEKIPGILILQGNKTYGRTENKKRLLYKCIPNNKEYQPILVPYDIPTSFSKSFVNRFILYSKQPNSDAYIMAENIGQVDDYESYVKYRMYCKKLVVSLSQFTKLVRENKRETILSNIISSKIYSLTTIKDRVITIDPNDCRDFDDAFSLETRDNGCSFIRIHIANPAIWIDAMELWSAFTERTTTIYLPHKKEPMLPIILSEDWISLCAGKEKKIGFTLEIEMDETHNVLGHRTYNSILSIDKNHVYETEECKKDPTYQYFKFVAEKWSNRHMDSHEVVEYWMIYMNQYCGKILAEKYTGIFRTSILKEEMSKIAEYRKWQNIQSQYTLWSNNTPNIHLGLNMENYVHITSPIRRLVDMLNQMILIDIEWGFHARMFLDLHIRPNYIEEINRQNKESRRIQQECNDLWWAIYNPEALSQEYEGIVFDETENEASVWIPSLGRVITAFSERADKNAPVKCRAYYFEKEGNLYRKIRWKICG